MPYATSFSMFYTCTGTLLLIFCCVFGVFNDQTFDAYVLGKHDAPGIVVLQEWWGVDFEIKNHAAMISQLGLGFKALIPE